MQLAGISRSVVVRCDVCGRLQVQGLQQVLVVAAGVSCRQLVYHMLPNSWWTRGSCMGGTSNIVRG
jgi:hypothetical protein